MQFVKLDALGKGGNYSWVLYKATHPQKFIEVSKGRKSYDAKFFGSYTSFVEGAEANQLYDDKRANVFNNKIFKRWLPFFALILLAGLYFVWNVFYGDGLVKKENEKVKAKPEATQSAKPVAAKPVAAEKAEPPPPKKPDFVRDLTEKYRLRVTAIIKSKHRQHAIFEWYDEGYRLRERMTMLALAQLGYTIVLDDDMQYAIVSKGDDQYIATQFPNDPDGKVSNATLRDIGGNQDRNGADIDSLNRSKDVVASADGYGVLGRAGAGVRQPAAPDKR